MSKIAVVSFKYIECEFIDIIKKINDVDQNNKATSPLIRRKTYTFEDESFLSITEFLTDDGIHIEKFHYDWFDSSKQIILKVHSEPHDEKECQTKTEPHHSHIPDVDHYGIYRRFPNEAIRTLPHLLELIRFCISYYRRYIKTNKKKK